MANIRSFGDAVKAAERAEEDVQPPVTVDILGREIVLEYPGSGQVVFMTAALAGNDGDITQVGEVVQFIYHLVSDEDQQYIKSKLLDRYSGFDGEAVIELIEYVTEEWSSRPTRSASSSSPSRRATGASSTAGARRKVSTSSTSRSAGS
jgi:hypothetical protein